MKKRHWGTFRKCLMVVIFMHGASGCRSMRTALTAPAFEDYQRQLVGRHYPEANRVLGPHLPVWTDNASGERYLRYPAPGAKGESEFYLARVSDRDVIVALSRWSAAGGELDAATTLPGTKTPLLGSLRDDSTAGGGRTTLITFADVAASGAEVDVHPTDGDLWGRQRVLMVECDERGVRRRARYFSIDGSLPSRGVASKSAMPQRRTMAARVDLFGEDKEPTAGKVEE